MMKRERVLKEKLDLLFETVEYLQMKVNKLEGNNGKTNTKTTARKNSTK